MLTKPSEANFATHSMCLTYICMYIYIETLYTYEYTDTNLHIHSNT